MSRLAAAVIPASLLLVSSVLICGTPLIIAQSSKQNQALSVDRLELHNVTAEAVPYKGIRSVMIKDSAQPTQDANSFALVRGLSLEDGTIEVMVSGDTAPDAPPQLRGFVGLEFRVSSDGSHFECLYLRPKNGRSEDQLQRNHSAQYISMPGFPWEKLRTESPEKYESYVDLIPGEWIRMKVEVKGSRARLYVNGAEQPTLIMNDLKQAPAAGGVALWIGPGTIAHFANLKISR